MTKEKNKNGKQDTVDNEISIPLNCHLKKNAFVFDDSISEEEFKEASKFLIGMDKSNRDCSIKFWIGDWINFGKKKFGLKKYKKTLFWDAGYSVGTLDNMSGVAKAIPQISRHREKLTFGHYQEIAPIKDEKEKELWLDIADKWELSVGELREIKSLIGMKANKHPDDIVDCTSVAGEVTLAAIKLGRLVSELLDFKKRISIEKFSKILEEGKIRSRFYGKLLLQLLDNLFEDTTSMFADPIYNTPQPFFEDVDWKLIQCKSFLERRGNARKKAILMSKLLREVRGEDEEKKYLTHIKSGKHVGVPMLPEKYVEEYVENEAWIEVRDIRIFYQKMGFTEEEIEILAPKTEVVEMIDLTENNGKLKDKEKPQSAIDNIQVKAQKVLDAEKEKSKSTESKGQSENKDMEKELYELMKDI